MSIISHRFHFFEYERIGVGVVVGIRKTYGAIVFFDLSPPMRHTSKNRTNL